MILKLVYKKNMVGESKLTTSYENFKGKTVDLNETVYVQKGSIISVFIFKDKNKELKDSFTEAWNKAKSIEGRFGFKVEIPNQLQETNPQFDFLGNVFIEDNTEDMEFWVEFHCGIKGWYVKYIGQSQTIMHLMHEKFEKYGFKSYFLERDEKDSQEKEYVEEDAKLVFSKYFPEETWDERY